MRFAFYVSGKAGRLIKFLQKRESHSDSIIMIFSDGVISNELRNIISSTGIVLVEFPYRNIVSSTKEEKRLILSNRLLASLLKYKIDYCFSFGSHILSGNLLSVYKNKLINFHPSILPLCRGLKAIDQAIKEKVFLVGTTVHIIDEGVDTGQIIMQSAVPMKLFFDSFENYDVILDIQVEMLEKMIYVLENNLLDISDNGVYIKNAIYSKHVIYPEITI